VASVPELTALAETALVVSLVVSLPVIAIAALVGLIVAGFQAATQLSDATLAHLPRLVAVALALAVTAPWMGAEIRAFALTAFAAR
jgi:flagellar biosynthetic protein FliQ